MDNLNQYSQLKFDLLALKEYIVGQYDLELSPHIDSVMAEMNDLLLGIERGQLSMPYKELRLSATWSATDGAYDDDNVLRKMIYKIQDDIYSIRKHIVIQQKPWYYFRKKYENVNWLFPNLNCKNGHIQCITYRDEDILEITFPNGYEIDLGYLDNEYVITITKNGDWTNILEEERIKLRSTVEEKLQNLINKYEKL